VLSIVVPAFDEEASLPALATRLHRVLRTLGVAYEVVIVDDGSRDGTWAVIERLHQDDARLLGLRLSRNFGHQHALLAGLHVARGEAVVTMDADLQHPPELIPALVERWRQGARVVNAVRVRTADASPLKRITSRGFSRVFSWLAGSPMSPGGADFRLLDAAVVAELRRFREPHLFLRGVVQWMGFSTAEVVFLAPARHAGRTKYSLRRMAGFGLGAVTSFSIVPLRLSIVLGLLTALAAFAELVYVLVIALVERTAVPGWASTLGVLSFLFGVLFILLGVVGEYVGRIFETVKARPLFIVADRLGDDPGEGAR
jgi:dolichol-phosphate mannosyltransferase